jgi:flagellar FliL protein
MAFVAAMVVLTGIAVGFGGLMGLQVVGRMEKQPAGEPAPKASAANGGVAAKDRYAGNVNLRPLAPIVTNLASPDKTWIRLEALLVMEGEQTPDAGTLSAQITEDIVAFLRTVSLTQIQGASGFQHLREDLNDRVRVRSGGKVRDLVVQSMIIE